jgi:hypothetical protein
LNEVDEVGAAEDADDPIPKCPRARFDGDVDDPWKDVLGCEGGNAPTPTLPTREIPRP